MDIQWFLKYSYEEWTAKTHEVLNGETIIPKEVKKTLNIILTGQMIGPVPGMSDLEPDFLGITNG